MTDLSKQKIALVYDRVNKWGGAERVLLVLHDLFPQAPLYTAVYNPATAEWAKVFPKVIPTFLQRLLFAKSNHELYPWLTPLAFESLNLDQYDAVISVTSADAKGIITKPGTFHFCYCLTPTRYLWSHELLYKKQVPSIYHPMFNYLKYWDQVASHRPDSYAAISKTVQSRISTYYHQTSSLIYPPVDVDVYSTPQPPPSIKDFFLYVGRLVFHKQPQVVIEAFNQIDLPLVIIGTGSEEKKLKKIAKPHIYFAGLVSDESLIAYYQHSKAVIFFHEEDFGLVPVEAHAAGKPVIALNRGGASEIVLHNRTGILLDDDSPNSLAAAVSSFDHTRFDPRFIKSHASKFSQERFKAEFVKVFTAQWSNYRKAYT
ncbi:MAG: glycosyl transferase group 1 [Microgenomates group bacterium Gr01-1014_16]|nr:MAG: glycosyl transferase group 1 [Microgenomates group bacterium Gr01-1014_16]